MERLNDILQPHVRASKVKLSYVDELFPDLKDNPYIVLYKNIPNIQLSDCEDKEKTFEYANHDVSGSPLEYSFDNCEFNNTTVITRQHWRKEEELYLSLNKTDATVALNICLEYLCDNTLPIIALCDGKDTKRSRLIGSIVSKDWFTTLEAVSTDVTTLSMVKNRCHKVVQEHLKQSFALEHNIKICVFNTFDLFGIKQEIIDWDKTVRSDFEGNINVEVYSNNLELDPRLSKNTLVAQINGGWKDSPLKELRCQLSLLNQYLSVIDECKENIGLQNVIKFATPYSEEHDAITEKLNFLLNGDLGFINPNSNNVEKINSKKKNADEIDAKLLKRVQDVSLRLDIDFTDLLWEILIKTPEYPQMISYIEIVLKEITEHKFKPQINDTNSTRFIKYISNLRRQETMSHLLMGSVPLELVVDMGFEKLIRDYLFILRGARFVNLHDIRQKLADISSGIFNTENYRKKLIMLAQIHICLECMLLIEEHLVCPIESLQSLFSHAYKEFISAQSPLQHYVDLCTQIFTLRAPLPNSAANELSKMHPSTWRASVSSHSVTSMLTTTTYYSKMPIFPNDTYPTDVNLQEEIVYGINAISSSTIYKRLDDAMLLNI